MEAGGSRTAVYRLQGEGSAIELYPRNLVPERRSARRPPDFQSGDSTKLSSQASFGAGAGN